MTGLWGWRRLGFFFVVVGTNSITAYLLARFLSFGGLAERVVQHGLAPLAGLVLLWGVLYLLHRKRWFLRV